MKTMKTTLFAAVAAFLCAASFAVKPGQSAPDFTLTDINGKEHALSDYAGKIVVLEWTNYGCPYVKNHYATGNMQRLQAAMADKEVVWLSICSSRPGSQGHMNPAQWRKEIEKEGVKSAAILIDETSKVARAYGAVTTPHMYVIDPQGVVVYNGAIDSIASTRPSSIEQAENYVAAAVSAVKAGKPVPTATSKPYGCGIKYASGS